MTINQKPGNCDKQTMEFRISRGQRNIRVIRIIYYYYSDAWSSLINLLKSQSGNQQSNTDQKIDSESIESIQQSISIPSIQQQQQSSMITTSAIFEERSRMSPLGQQKSLLFQRNFEFKDSTSKTGEDSSEPLLLCQVLDEFIDEDQFSQGSNSSMQYALNSKYLEGQNFKNIGMHVNMQRNDEQIKVVESNTYLNFPSNFSNSRIRENCSNFENLLFKSTFIETDLGFQTSMDFFVKSQNIAFGSTVIEYSFELMQPLADAASQNKQISESSLPSPVPSTVKKQFEQIIEEDDDEEEEEEELGTADSDDVQGSGQKSDESKNASNEIFDEEEEEEVEKNSRECSGKKQKQRRPQPKKNVVKNYVKAFRNFVNQSEHEHAVLATLKAHNSSDINFSTLSESDILYEFRLAYKKFEDSNKFNNTFIKYLITQEPFKPVFHRFVSNEAHTWLNSSCVNNKKAHEMVLCDYIRATKDLRNIDSVHSLRSRTRQVPISKKSIAKLTY